MWIVTGVTMLAGGCLMAAAVLLSGGSTVDLQTLLAVVQHDRLHLAAGAIVGFVAGAALVGREGLSRRNAAFAAIVAGAAVILVLWHRADDRIARASLALIAFGFVFPFARHEILAYRRRPEIAQARQPMQIALIAPFVLLGPALLGDPTPGRSALALSFGASALGFALIAASEARKGKTFEVAAWSGGLGGGRSGFTISRPLAILMLALGLAGAAAATLVVTDRNARDDCTKEKTEKGENKSSATKDDKSGAKRAGCKTSDGD